MKQMWEERYGRDEYAYGEEPNAFFKACLDRLPAPGRLLLPGEGEGRNAVYAARQGWTVHAFDFSAAGREKALRLADRYGVHIDYEVADYETAHLEPESFDAVALIFTHMHERIRRTVHRKLVSALKPGGHLFLEAYSPEQLREVIDADTLLLDIDLGFEVIRRQSIRLARIDAPPRDTHKGAAGRRFVREQLAVARTVVINTRKYDIHRRYVAHVFFTFNNRGIESTFLKGRYLNQELIDKGFAKPV